MPNVYFQPDSIAQLGDRIFIGYGNGAAPDGSDGKSSTIVEYKSNGDVVNTYTVIGHNDGLRVDPRTNQLWAMQNEDGNPNLVIIDTTQRNANRPIPLARRRTVADTTISLSVRATMYLSAHRIPPNNPNDAPAIVRQTSAETWST